MTIKQVACFLLFQIIVAVPLALMVYWAISLHLTDLDSDKFRVYMHALLMVFSFTYLLGQGIAAFRTCPTTSRGVSRLCHSMFNTLALVVGLIALFLMLSYKVEFEKPHLTSVHSWCGIFLILVMLIQILGGCSVLQTCCCKGVVAPNACYTGAHIAMGLSTLLLAAASIISGVQRLKGWILEADDIESHQFEAILLNAVVISSVLLLVIILCVSVSRRVVQKSDPTVHNNIGGLQLQFKDNDYLERANKRNSTIHLEESEAFSPGIISRQSQRSATTKAEPNRQSVRSNKEYSAVPTSPVKPDRPANMGDPRRQSDPRRGSDPRSDNIRQNSEPMPRQDSYNQPDGRNPRQISDPRMDHRQPNGDPRQQTPDPRLQNGDPRLQNGDPRQVVIDPRVDPRHIMRKGSYPSDKEESFITPDDPVSNLRASRRGKHFLNPSPHSRPRPSKRSVHFFNPDVPTAKNAAPRSPRWGVPPPLDAPVSPPPMFSPKTANPFPSLYGGQVLPDHSARPLSPPQFREPSDPRQQYQQLQTDPTFRQPEPQFRQPEQPQFVEPQQFKRPSEPQSPAQILDSKRSQRQHRYSARKIKVEQANLDLQRPITPPPSSYTESLAPRVTMTSPVPVSIQSSVADIAESVASEDVDVAVPRRGRSSYRNAVRKEEEEAVQAPLADYRPPVNGYDQRTIDHSSQPNGHLNGHNLPPPSNEKNQFTMNEINGDQENQSIYWL